MDSARSVPLPPACNTCRARKVKCGREQPTCSNCTKASLHCDFRNKPRRVNHTKQLADDFSKLSDRLESIDTAIAKLNHRLGKGSSAATPSTKSSDEEGDNNMDWNFYDFSNSLGDIQYLPVGASEDPDRQRHCMHASDPNGIESCYGPTSAPRLAERTRLLVEELSNGRPDSTTHITPSPHHQKSLQDRHSRALSTSEDPFHTVPEEMRQEVLSDPAFASSDSQTRLRHLQDSFPFNSHCQTYAVGHDGENVNRPPQVFVENALETYLAENNHVFPLFDEHRLREAVHTHYLQPSAPITGAKSDTFDLLLNNCVVLVLGAKLRASKFADLGRCSLDNELFAPFLAKSRRAFDNIDRYDQAKLLNVQVLITLALIAAEHLPQGYFERLVQRACRVAREMGLPHYKTTETQDDASPEERERRMTFWTLYTLDKLKTFVTGTACDLYLFDSSIELIIINNEEEGSSEKTCLAAKLQLLSLWETIWLDLYCSQALRCKAEQRHHRAVRNGEKLRRWADQHRRDLEDPSPSHPPTNPELWDVLAIMRLELRYCYHIGQVLVWRCRQQHSSTATKPTTPPSSPSEESYLSHARAVISILAATARAPGSALGVSLLSRMYRMYSFVAFYELHYHLLFNWDADSESDHQLLNDCLAGARLFAAEDRSLYLAKLTAGMEWCLGVNKAVCLAKAYPVRAVGDFPSMTPSPTPPLQLTSSTPPMPLNFSMYASAPMSDVVATTTTTTMTMPTPVSTIGFPTSSVDSPTLDELFGTQYLQQDMYPSDMFMPEVAHEMG